MLTAAVLSVVLADPTVIVAGATVVAEKNGSGWRTPQKNLNGKKLTLKGWKNGAIPDLDAEVEYDEGPPMESVRLKGDGTEDETKLYVSGNPSFFPATKIESSNAEYQKIASDYAKSRKRVSTKLVVSGYVMDLDGDGRREALMVITSNPNTPKSKGFTAIVLRYMAGGKAVNKTLEFNGTWGYMRGPFSGRSYGVGDYDGDGKREFLYTFEDPWGVETKLHRFENGKVRHLCTTAWGE